MRSFGVAQQAFEAEEHEQRRGHRGQPARRPDRHLRQGGEDQPRADQGQRTQGEAPPQVENEPNDQDDAAGDGAEARVGRDVDPELREPAQPQDPQEVRVALDGRIASDVEAQAVSFGEVARVTKRDEGVVVQEVEVTNEQQVGRQHDRQDDRQTRAGHEAGGFSVRVVEGGLEGAGWLCVRRVHPGHHSPHRDRASVQTLRLSTMPRRIA